MRTRIILHVFPKSIFLDNFLDFIEANFSDMKHDFIVLDIGGASNSRTIYSEGNRLIGNLSIFNPLDMFKLYGILRKSRSYNNIIFHSLYLNYLLPALLFNMSLVCKSTLCLWGTQDVGPFIVPISMRKYALLGFFYEKLRKIIIRNFKFICSIVIEDYEKVKSLYNIKGLYKRCKYIVAAQSNYVHKEPQQKCNYINIQVSHSGYSANLTLEILDKLRPYRDFNIRIYAPLSYGEDGYIKQVILKGKELFGKKFIPLMKQMTQENYARFVSSMDIYINNCIEQNGVGNIIAHITSGNKVYLFGDGVMFANYKTKDGYFVYATESIDGMPFDSFVRFEDIERRANVSKSVQLFDENELIDIWTNILS